MAMGILEPEVTLPAPSPLRPFLILGGILGVTAALVFFIGFRLSQRGNWLPDTPERLGVWLMTEKPLTRQALQQLGNPDARGRTYENPFEEKVDVHVISTTDYQSYLDPQFTMGAYEYTVTAEKALPIFGTNSPIRALIFKSGKDQRRYLMYYWIQNQDGSTNIRDTLKRDRDFAPRLLLGLGATFSGTQNCIVRVFTPLSPADINGAQARRNLNEVCIGLHDFWIKGKKP